MLQRVATRTRCVNIEEAKRGTGTYKCIIIELIRLSMHIGFYPLYLSSGLFGSSLPCWSSELSLVVSLAKRMHCVCWAPNNWSTLLYSWSPRGIPGQFQEGDGDGFWLSALRIVLSAGSWSQIYRSTQRRKYSWFWSVTDLEDVPWRPARTSRVIIRPYMLIAYVHLSLEVPCHKAMFH